MTEKETVPELIERIRRWHPLGTYTEYNIPVFDRYDSPTEKRNGCSRCKTRGPCEALQAASALESVTVPTEFDGDATPEALEAWVRYRSLPTNPGTEGYGVEQTAQDAFTAAWDARTHFFVNNMRVGF